MLNAKKIFENTGDKPVVELHKKDITDGRYEVYDSPERHIEFRVHNKKSSLACEDYGDDCKFITGKDEYEFYYNLDEENTHHFLASLRTVYGCKKPIGELLKDVFGCDDGTVKFFNFCQEQNITTDFHAL